MTVTKTELLDEKDRELIEKAIGMMAYSYVPYSRFRVGAALLGKSGRIYTGCNVENASYGITNCAERTAFFKAVSEGERSFEAIAIVGGLDGVMSGICTPCGVCRQVMREFCDPETFRIVLPNGEGEAKIYTLEEMLPESFGPGNLSL